MLLTHGNASKSGLHLSCLAGKEEVLFCGVGKDDENREEDEGYDGLPQLDLVIHKYRSSVRSGHFSSPTIQKYEVTQALSFFLVSRF